MSDSRLRSSLNSALPVQGWAGNLRAPLRWPARFRFCFVMEFRLAGNSKPLARQSRLVQSAGLIPLLRLKAPKPARQSSSKGSPRAETRFCHKTHGEGLPKIPQKKRQTGNNVLEYSCGQSNILFADTRDDSPPALVDAILCPLWVCGSSRPRPLRADHHTRSPGANPGPAPPLQRGNLSVVCHGRSLPAAFKNFQNL